MPDVGGDVGADDAIAIKALNDLSKALSVTTKKALRAEDLLKILKRLPTPDQAREVVQTARDQIQQSISVQESRSRDLFEAVVGAYIAALRESDRPCREITRYRLRVGVLTFEADERKSTIRFLYNDETIVTGHGLRTIEEVMEKEREALRLLEERTVPRDVFHTHLLEAFRQANWQQGNFGEEKSQRIRDLYRPVCLELLKAQAIKGKDVSITNFHYPFYCFLHNLDLYREELTTLPQNLQLMFAQGGQLDTERHGVLLNGLDPMSQYSCYCYLRPVRTDEGR